MANILVVGKLPEKEFVNIVNGYRGVDREYIQYPTEYYDANSPIMAINRAYNSLTENDAYIHDIDFAIKLRNIYNRIYPDSQREILEIVFNNERAQLKGKLLGFDIIDSDSSNILRIILWYSNIDKAEVSFMDAFERTLHIVSINLVTLLNNNQLFNDYLTASVALGIIDDIFSYYQKKSKHHKYKVAGIYLVEGVVM